MTDQKFYKGYKIAIICMSCAQRELQKTIGDAPSNRIYFSRKIMGKGVVFGKKAFDKISKFIKSPKEFSEQLSMGQGQGVNTYFLHYQGPRDL